jgi:hypothetical protein
MGHNTHREGRYWEASKFDVENKSMKLLALM